MLVSIITLPTTGTKVVVSPTGQLTKPIKNYLNRIGMSFPTVLTSYPEELKKGVKSNV